MCVDWNPTLGLAQRMMGEGAEEAWTSWMMLTQNQHPPAQSQCVPQTDGASDAAICMLHTGEEIEAQIYIKLQIFVGVCGLH